MKEKIPLLLVIAAAIIFVLVYTIQEKKVNTLLTNATAVTSAAVSTISAATAKGIASSTPTQVLINAANVGQGIILSASGLKNYSAANSLIAAPGLIFNQYITNTSQAVQNDISANKLTAPLNALSADVTNLTAATKLI